MTSFLERLPGPALGKGVRALLIVVGLSPFLPPLLEGVPILQYIGAAFDGWFQFQCHREAARSFSLLGHTMPVCARCFGIYAGLGLGALVLRPRLDVWPLRIWVGVGAAAMILDVVTENLGMHGESGWFRFVTGAFLAFPVGVALVWASRGEVDSEAETGTVGSSGEE